MTTKEQALYEYCYEAKHSEGRKEVEALFEKLLAIMEMPDEEEE